MSNIKGIKEEIKSLSSCNKICDSMMSIARIKFATAQQKKQHILKKLKILGSFLKLKKEIFRSPRVSLVYYSDFGFCGSFNKYKLQKNELAIGHKQENSESRAVSSSDYKEFHEYVSQIIQKSMNITFKINSNDTMREIHFYDFSKHPKKPVLLEVDHEEILEAYKNLFIEYVYNVGKYNENLARSKTMKQAVDNSGDIIHEKTLDLSKLKQNLVTNEISLLVSGQGG